MGFMYSIFNTSIPKQAPYLRCSYLALLSFHPFIIVIGKGAKNLPIYKKFFRIFSSVRVSTLLFVLGGLLMQAKTCLYSISGAASTVCVMTQGIIASRFSQIFPVEYL